ncbi:hypothetical protein ACFE04_001119 [Oxalis oulophora]
MKSNLYALNVDLQDFFVQLYNVILEYRPGRLVFLIMSTTTLMPYTNKNMKVRNLLENDAGGGSVSGSVAGEVLAEALKIMLCDDRQHDMQKAAAFVKRLATFSLCFGSAESMAGLFSVKPLLRSEFEATSSEDMKVQNLLENDVGGGSVSGSVALEGVFIRSRSKARKSDQGAVADYLNNDLPDKLCPDDVFLTLGCTQAIEIVLTVLARPGANILLPRPGFPYYEAICGQRHLEFRHFDLLPEKGWEVDLTAIEALADAKTTAMVIINPGNPTGSVYSYQHLQKVAETAKKLGILVIADEVYGHLAFGDTPFTPMGVFSSTVPIITLGSISKRWIVPGWRIGWLITNDPHAILKDTGIVDSIKGFLNLSSDPATFIQGAIPRILENTKPEFFSKIIGLLREAAQIFHEKIKQIPCITCPNKPEGSMFMMVKLNLSLLEDINDDVDFCLKLAKEQNTIVLPGVAVGMKNWLRITFAIDPSALSDGLERIKCFYEGHAKKR